MKFKILWGLLDVEVTDDLGMSLLFTVVVLAVPLIAMVILQ